MFIKQGLQVNVRMFVALVVMISMAIALLSGAHTFAQTSSGALNTLKVSPVRSDIEISPGQSKTVQITITNLTNKDVTVSAIENDFVSGDENGTPALILDADKYAPTHSLKRFMTPLKDVTILANKAKLVDVVITVPASAQAGGYFGAVRFAPANPDGGAQVNLSGSVASLILLNVPGDAIEKLNLTDFTIQQNGKSNAFFTSSDNLASTFRFENKGSVQLGPIGKISVKKWGTIISETDFNAQTPRDLILPDGARRWTVPIDKADGFGHYTVLATLTYGKNNETVEVVRSFWVIPVVYMIGAVVALILLAAIIFFIIFFIRRRLNRRSSNRSRGGLSVNGRRRR